MSVILDFKANGKPVLRGQAYMWTVLRKRGVDALFTASEISLESNHRDNGCARDFCRRLVANGIAELDHERPHERNGNPQKVYRLIKAPRILPPINRSGKTPRQHLGQQFMWNCLRRGHLFNARELAAFASTDKVAITSQTAKSYLGHLNRAGYLICVRASVGSEAAVYRLDPAHNTGPNAPMILRSKLVFDPNKEELPGTIQAEAAS